MPRLLLALLALGFVALVGMLVGDLRAQEPPPAPTTTVALAPPPVVTEAEPAPEPAPLATAPPPDAQPPQSRGTASAGPSRALGLPFRRGRLVRGVQLPAEGRDHVTWDPILHRVPNRGWRRWGTDRLLAVVLAGLEGLRALHPDAPPVLVGDLSRPRGGIFDNRFGGLGHASHQNGLDADVYYPRKDRRLIAPRKPSEVDRVLAQALVDRYVALGAERVFVGPRLRLKGPSDVVVPLVHHDDHLHVRIPPR